MKINLQEPEIQNNSVKFKGSIVNNDDISNEIYYKIPPSLYNGNTDIFQKDSFFLIGSLFAAKLNIFFDYPYFISPKLRCAVPQITKMLNIDNKSLFRKAYHSIKFALLHSVPLQRKSPPISAINKSGQYFTLGLDSFYTLLCLKKQPNYLIFIEGFDIENNQKVLMNKVRNTISFIALQTNTKALFVQSNLREVSDKIISWEKLHGAACASVVYYLTPWMDTVYTNNVKTFHEPSSYWGSGPRLDPLFSTEYMNIKSSGHDKNRFDKALELSKHKNFNLVLKYVRPCWRNDNKGPEDFNCCLCEKCARTYLALVASTGKINIPAFNKFSLDNLDKIEFKHNRETQLSWLSIYKHLIRRFGRNSKIVFKSKRFTY